MTCFGAGVCLIIHHRSCLLWWSLIAVSRHARSELHLMFLCFLFCTAAPSNVLNAFFFVVILPVEPLLALSLHYEYVVRASAGRQCLLALVVPKALVFVKRAVDRWWVATKWAFLHASETWMEMQYVNRQTLPCASAFPTMANGISEIVTVANKLVVLCACFQGMMKESAIGILSQKKFKHTRRMLKTKGGKSNIA